MKESTFQVLDALSRNIGRAMPIRELNAEIGRIYGKAYYKNTYDEAASLAKKNIIAITRAGKSSLTELDFSNPGLIDLLSEIDLKRKRSLLEENPRFFEILYSLESELRAFHCIDAALLSKPLHGFKLRRLEIIFFMRMPGIENGEELFKKDALGIIYAAKQCENRHGIKIDCLFLETGFAGRNELFELLGSEDGNPLPEMLSNKIAFLSPQTFWAYLQIAFRKGLLQNIQAGEFNPAKISEEELGYNLNRFGYSEFGPGAGRGQKICLELLIAALLIKNDARRIDAIPMLLAKNNGKIHYPMLVFLCRKYGKGGALLGLLNALGKLKPTIGAAFAAKMLEAMGEKKEKPNETAIKQKMVLYDAF